MIQSGTPNPSVQRQREAWGIGIFLVVLLGGLFYAKWNPYFHKAFLAAAHHSLGASIISGTSAHPPAASWGAAWAYFLSYGKAIWEALVVGLLVGSGVQALLPRSWLLRVLGRTSYRSTAIAGLASVPGMM